MKTILLKLSGELFKGSNTLGNICMNAELVTNLTKHIKKLRKTHQFNIVIGGGNFFRGQKEGAHLGLQQSTADAVGMLATIMNGLMLRDFFEKEGADTTRALTFRLWLEHEHKTLEKAEIDNVWKSVVETLQKQNVTVRM